MKKLNDFLTQHVSEQIGLEEHLCKIIDQQIAEIKDTEFADAKDLLVKTREVLENHFIPLNKVLDGLERNAVCDLEKSVSSNGKGILQQSDLDQRKNSISIILRDDYSALSLITIGNTLLHTTALALGCQEVADIALKHLQNLAPLVVRIGKLLPQVVARELRTAVSTVDLSIAEIALKNTQLVWRNAS